MLTNVCRRTTILLMDENAASLDRLKTMLESRGFEVVGHAANGDEAVYLCSRLRPEIALLDTSLDHLRPSALNGPARLDSIGATRKITKVCPSTRVILMARQPDTAHIAKGVSAGVSGYILKPMVAESLADAICAVTEGAILLGAGVSLALRTAMPGLHSRV